MSAGVTGASGLLSGVSQYEAGQARSQLFRANASVAASQFQSEAQAGAYNEEMMRMRGTALTGQQVAQIGASNLQQRGTPAQVVASSAEMNELNAITTRNNALRRAWGFEVQQQSDLYQASKYQSAGIEQGIGSILTGGAKAGQQYNQTGTWF